MKEKIKISDKVRAMTEEFRKRDYISVSPNWKTNAIAQLSIERANDRVEKIEILINKNRKCKILEIGCGAGLLVALLIKKGYDAYGLEPDKETFLTALQLFKDNGLNNKRLINVSAEDVLFKDKFDLIVSFQVIEHTKEPEKVISSCYKNLKKSGRIYFVIPNYNSFWEGHYALLWMPFFNKSLAKIYVRLWGRDPSFIDTLYFISPAYIRKILLANKFKIHSLGEETFKKRMHLEDNAFYGDTYRLQLPVRFFQTLKLSTLLSWIMVKLEWFYPIIIEAEK